jgi:NTP pyrophosphatase (non-canonical NTP hydrolase)
LNHQTEEIMTILQEECAEVITCISKCRRFGLHTLVPFTETKETNMSRLSKELGDVLAMIDLLVEQKLVTNQELEEYKQSKIEKLKKWSNIKINKK